MSPAEGVDETSRSLGRIEQQLETASGERAENRDELKALNERQHKASNAIQGISSQVTVLQKAVDGTKADMGDVKTRLAALEAPIKRAMARQKQRRQFWVKIVSVAVGVSGLVWLILQPMLKALGDAVVTTYAPALKRLFGLS